MGFDLVPLSPLNSVQMPANANGERSSFRANHTTSFFLVSGFVSGAYSAKLFAGTRQRFSGLSQARQCGDDVFADVGDWVPASTRRRWHSPAHHHNLRLTGSVAHDRRWIIREYAGHGRQISDILVHHPEQRDDRRLVRGDRIEIAHEVLHPSQG